VSSQFDVDQNAGEETFGLEVDILRNAIRSYAWPVQAESMGPMFRYLRGLVDSVIESETFTEGDDPVVLPGAIGVFMQALETPGTSVIMVDSTNLSELLSLPLSGLPAEVTSQLSDTQVTLNRDEFFDVTLTLTQTTADELLAFDFSVDVSIDGVAPAITKSAIGSLRTRNEIVSVTSVIVDQPFVDPGEQANVSARILNAVNRQRDVSASFIVKNSAGVTAIRSRKAV
jgi:hypothetical protein